VLVLRLEGADPGAGGDEAVARHAVLDAQALEIAGAVRRADALQAAHRLGARRGERVALLDLVEALGAPSLGDTRHRGAFGRLGGDAHLEPDGAAFGEALAELAQFGSVGELLEVGLGGVDGQPFLELDEIGTPQPGVDGERRAFAGGDGVDDRAGAGHGVAGGEHAVARRASREAVRRERVPGREGELLGGIAEVGHV